MSDKIVTHPGNAVPKAFTQAQLDWLPWLEPPTEESLSRRVVYSKSDLVTYSPTTQKHVESGLTVGEICEAAMVLSDNTAGNLLLDSFGGPAGLTSFMRSLGDTVTRLDRRETELNEAAPGDPRDTTTPLAVLDILRKAVLGNALSASSREQLSAWLVANKTGDKRLRAGVPKGWRVGDKTGSGSNNATNDIAEDKFSASYSGFNVILDFATYLSMTAFKTGATRVGVM